jgi:hypothetical protein
MATDTPVGVEQFSWVGGMEDSVGIVVVHPRVESRDVGIGRPWFPIPVIVVTVE